jgi:NADPH:quinone reductase-like Zn-dependent oxidoreductase
MTPEVEAKALVQRSQGEKQALRRESVRLPEAASNQALVKVQYVAQNPTDSMMMMAMIAMAQTLEHHKRYTDNSRSPIA